MRTKTFRLIWVTLIVLVGGCTAVMADGSVPRPICYPGDSGCPNVHLVNVR
ncbi:MAG: hypothetical protein JWQ87_5265 [Candidatus Sulfotelmatobacter sp.]|nr:hypothetical protein [Candidatus Sulfotelmatobacter sp.]